MYVTNISFSLNTGKDKF